MLKLKRHAAALLRTMYINEPVRPVSLKADSSSLTNDSSWGSDAPRLCGPGVGGWGGGGRGRSSSVQHSTSVGCRTAYLQVRCLLLSRPWARRGSYSGMCAKRLHRLPCSCPGGNDTNWPSRC